MDVTRGSTVVFVAGFTDSVGAVVNPASANLYVTYRKTGTLVTDTVALTQSGNSWSGSWDSSIADAGQTDWCIKTAGSNKAALQGFFFLKANRANPSV